MIYLDCRMLQGSGISTYLMGLIRIYKKNHNINIRYLVKKSQYIKMSLLYLEIDLLNLKKL